MGARERADRVRRAPFRAGSFAAHRARPFAWPWRVPFGAPPTIVCRSFAPDRARPFATCRTIVARPFGACRAPPFGTGSQLVAMPFGAPCAFPFGSVGQIVGGSFGPHLVIPPAVIWGDHGPRGRTRARTTRMGFVRHRDESTAYYANVANRRNPEGWLWKTGRAAVEKRCALLQADVCSGRDIYLFNKPTNISIKY